MRDARSARNRSKGQRLDPLLGQQLECDRDQPLGQRPIGQRPIGQWAICRWAVGQWAIRERLICQWGFEFFDS